MGKIFNIAGIWNDRMDLPDAKLFRTRRGWRSWLEKNHGKKREVWLVYFKKHTGKASITHGEAVEEALCFGWIDSTVRKIDDERYMQKFTPRNKNSVWSRINRDAAVRLIEEGKMTAPGLEMVDAAKRSGMWKAAYTSKRRMRMPPDLKKALMKNKKAWDNFSSFANSYQNMYLGWVSSAKRKETRERRIKEVVKRSKKNQKPGMM
jgi:uncharacterized protein YdeI (YjbR/CyaY-like superfamily)